MLFWVYDKKHKTVTDTPPKIIYVNKIGNRITFGITSRYYLKILTPETMEWLGRAKKKKIDKDKNGENVLHLEIAEVVLVHCNVINDDYQ